MQADAYRRARTLLSSQGDLTRARVLGAIHSLLLLALLATASLFVVLMATRGDVRILKTQKDVLPEWAASQAISDGEFLRIRNSGILPLIANNLVSDNPLHRFGAQLMNAVTAALQPLRNNLGALTSLLAIGLFLMLVLSFLTQWRRRVMARAATEIATTLRHQIHRQMYRLGQSSLPTEGVGPVVNIWTREVNDIREGLLADLDTTPRMEILTIGLVLIALLTSPILTLVLGSLGGLVWLISSFLNRDARLAHDAALRDVSVQLCLLHEDLGLLRTVRIHGVENYDRQRFDEHLDRFQQADLRRIVTAPTLNPTTALLYGAALTIAVFILGYNVLIREQISVATMLVLIAALSVLAHPIACMRKTRSVIRQANRSANGVFEFLTRSPELHQNVGAHFLAALKEQIVLDKITLKSRSGRTLLDGASLEITAGSRTVILGLDEDAKHALVCLIPRLIDPQSGRVLVDGHDLREVTLESIRAQVGTVLQADLVFTDSVLVNIGMGDPFNGLPRVIEAAKASHAHQFIQDLPHGYETVIGPLGHYLTPDQQFRIALARAYLHDPSIVILEEPATPLDDDTKQFLDDTLARLAEARTMIILPHRLSTIRSADQVIVLHNGQVEDIGSPAQLQAESKLFRHLLYLEFNEYVSGELEAGLLHS
jgi:ABC-type multidrug transport system fused ATPase/permease subunit